MGAKRRHWETVLLLGPAVLVLLLTFIGPLVRLFTLAFTDEMGPLATFTVLLESSVYRRVMINTFLVALLVTVVTILLAWPVAYALSKLKGLAFTVVLYGVLFPFWISVLVRTFSWMLLLERNGPVNRFLIELGVTDQPLALMFNDVGVVVGMVHILLPYMVLPLYAAMSRIDRNLLLASDGLGAGLLDTFRRVYLPLCLPGIAGGASFVFLLSLGFFITPALLGGANAITLSMLIANFVNERLAWSLAAAGSMVLLVIVLAIMAFAARLLPLDKGLVAK
ncbi:putative spermidine/putrescine transport system permease protein [Rhodoligotrophos appendicifer]|uniref:ABC transporter permease n=1 Tax=Rhodoligotrophos appendicifer TaxID=987056 RepID=UPI001FE70881|nr:ABC transporter permease [Rhodoligotrophos appendicifer]